ncbi:MAG: response regulator [Candidatus Tectomicrobia bacterium]|nr:response regulator [Candidatus Tectomicrobia bacterium]
MMGRRSVWLIDGDAHDIRLTQRAFRQAGLDHDLEVVRSVDEALISLLSHKGDRGASPGARPALILLDTSQLPVDLCETVRRLKQAPQMKRTPILILATSGCADEVRRAYEAGANAYLVKPIDSRRFALLMAQIGAFWLELVELPFDW